MTFKLRDNLYFGDINSLLELNKHPEITSIVSVADDWALSIKDVEKYRYINIGLSLKKMNPSYIKDLAAHCVKYQMQYGEVVLVVAPEAFKRPAFIACRVVCELEGKGILEVLQEVKKQVPDFKMGDAYL